MNTKSGMLHPDPPPTEKIQFNELFKPEEIQQLQDLFSQATGVASIITHPDGTPITRPSNFCRLCSGIIRKTEKGSTFCNKSDEALGNIQNSTGPAVQKCLSAGLWEASVSIIAGGNHIANWFIGQVRNNEWDEQRMIRYADEIGANRDDFMEALNEVPVMSVEQFSRVSDMLYAFAGQLSEKSYQNWLLKAQIDDYQSTANDIRKNEWLNRRIVETASEGIWELDNNHNTVFINSKMAGMLGYTIEEIMAKKMTEFIFSEDFPDITQKRAERTAGKSGFYERRFKQKNGAELWTLVSSVPIFDKDGVFTGSFGMLQDITGRRKAEEHLRESEERYRSVLNASPDAIAITDLDGKVLMFSSVSLKMFGYDREEELLGHLVTDFIITADQERALLNVSRMFEGIMSGPGEYLGRRKNGSTLFIEANAEFIRGIDGQAIQIVFIIRDISERKRVEEELKENREKYRGLSEAAFESIFFSEKGICIEQNQAAEKMFGYSCDEAIGRYGTEWIVPEDRERVMDNMLHGYEEPYEATALRKDGTTFPCVLRGKMMHYKGRNVRVTSLTDNSGIINARETLMIKDWAIESALNPIVIADLKGNITYANQACLQLWGYGSQAEIIGKSALDFWQTGENTGEVLSTLLSKGAWTGDLAARRKDGSPFYVHLVTNLVLDNNNQPVCMLASVADITERKRQTSILEARLRMTEFGVNGSLDDVYRLAVNELEHLTNSQLGFFLEIAQDQKTVLRQVWSTNTALNCVEDIGSHYPVDQAGIWTDCFFAHRIVVHNNYAALSRRKGLPDGHSPLIRFIEVPVMHGEIVSAIIGVGNKPTDYTDTDAETVSLLVNHVWDIIENRQIQEKIRQTETYFKALIEKASDGIAMVNLQGRFTYVSPSATTMFDYENLDFDKQLPDELTHPDDLPEVKRILMQIILNPSLSPTIQYRFKHHSGTWIWIESTFRNLLAEPGIEGIVINFRDISERKKAENQISELNQELDLRVKQRTIELEAAIKELETFSYSVSHDLKAPLRHISGFIGIFLENKSTELNEEELGYLDRISASAIEMGKLIDAILTFSRLNTKELRKTSIPAAAMVQQVIKFFEPEIRNRNISFNIGPLPDIEGDEDLIRQVWTNLLSNAIKYTGKQTEAIVEIGAVPNDHETTFFVKDNGAGFSMKYAEKLFNVFQRLHKTRDFDGVGIGLANVKRIISRHGGHCRAEGAPDAGATFYFSLPNA